MDLQGGGGNLQASPGTLQVGTNVQPGTGVPLTNVQVQGSSGGTSGGTTSGGTGVTGGSVATDPGAIAYWNDVISQLQSQLGAAQNEQPVGLANINNAFTNSQNELNQEESQAESGYAQNRATNQANRESNIGGIDANANATFNSLMSLLGAGGAGVSSAARYGAPQAVAKDASGKRAGAVLSFNANAGNIDQAENSTKTQYGNASTDLGLQRDNQISSFLSSLLGNEAQLEQQIGAAQINKAQAGGESYATASANNNTTSAVNSIEQQLQDIFNQYATPSFTPKAVTVTQPNLTSYTVDPTTIKAANANPNTDISVLPYLASLKQNNNAGNLLVGGVPASAATAGAAA